MVSQMKRGVTEGTTISADEVVAGVNAIMGGDHSVDYGRGISSGLFLKQTELEYDKDMLLQAMREALAGETSKLNENEMRAEMMGMQQEVAGRQKAKAEAQAEKNLAAANAFLEKNKEVAGIITTPTGLQYKMLKEGSGEAPKPDQLVEVHMSMSLVEGKEVEKSSPDKPRTMSQNVNKGFGEAVKLLKPGGQIQFWVPPALGYATSPRPGIPANSVLAYTVELVGVKDAPATQPAQGATLAPQVMPAPPPGAEKKPITATTPPISVEIPPKPQDGSPQPPPKIEQVKPEDMPKEK
jgi:FKBP-type peptidyl-prolyl cis-trans isomerase